MGTSNLQYRPTFLSVIYSPCWDI